MPRNRWHFCI